MGQEKLSGYTFLCLDWGQTQQELYNYWGVLDGIGFNTLPIEISFWLVTVMLHGEGSYKLRHQLTRSGEKVHEYPAHTRIKAPGNKDIFFMEIVGQTFDKSGEYCVESYALPADGDSEILIASYPFSVHPMTVK